MTAGLPSYKCCKINSVTLYPGWRCNFGIAVMGDPFSGTLVMVQALPGPAIPKLQMVIVVLFVEQISGGSNIHVVLI